MAKLEQEKRDLKFEELVSIRRSITEGIVDGEMKDELALRRESLAEQIDCLEGQVRSVGAHLRISSVFSQSSLKKLSFQISRERRRMGIRRSQIPCSLQGRGCCGSDIERERSTS